MSESIVVELGELAPKIPSVNPAKFPDEIFDLLSIPAYDAGAPQVVSGSEIGSNKQLVEPGDVMISKIVPHIRRVWVVPEPSEQGRRQLASSEWIVFRTNRVLNRWLRFYLLSDSFHPQFMNTVAGVGGSLLRARPQFVKKIKLTIPPVAQQKEEAEIEELKATIQLKRERQQELFKELKSSLFQSIIEEENETVNLGDVASFIGGSSLPTGEPFTGQEGGILLMKVSDMNTPGNNNEIHHTSLWVSEHENDNQIVPAGSVVIPKRGASIATNKKRLITRPTVLDPNLMAITPKSEKLSSQFLYHWFLQFNLTSITSGSSVPQLNKKDLSPLLIKLPKCKYQEKFINIINTIGD